MKCVLPGCGRELTPEQEKKWKQHRGKKRFAGGPYCSRECSHDAQKTPMHEAPKRRRHQSKKRR